jgi:AbrB family looped-hinge helix DNA binding protein
MALVRVKQKGQVTIPVHIRERLHLEVGSVLEADVDGRTIVLKPKAVVDWEPERQAGSNAGASASGKET